MGLGYVDKTLDDCHRQMFPHRDEGEDTKAPMPTPPQVCYHHRQFKGQSKGINQEPLLPGSGDSRPRADTTTSS